MSHKLLLADDSVTIQRVIELTFADEDVEVIAVGDGGEAIRRIEADRPDIVLADIGMPEKDGYEVAAFVKNTPHLSHIPVLLLTGAFEPVDEQRAQEVGCDGVLAKPFEPQMVITRVNELLEAAMPPRASGPGLVPPSARQASPLIAAPAVAPAPAAAASPIAPVAKTPSLSPLDAFLSEGPETDLDTFIAPTAQSSAPVDAVKALESAEPATVAAPAPAAEPVAAPESAEAAAPSTTEAAIASAPATAPEAPGSSAVKISRRAPIAMPGLPAPEQQTGGASPAELDDYFEKLDAAFASLHQAPPPAVGSPAVPAPTLSDVIAESDAEPAPEGGDLSEPPQGIAQAFSALLAAEHGQAAPAPSSAAQPVRTLAPELMNELVERVAEKVLERLSDRVVRETVTDIVSRVSERLVREEIDRVKATIK